MACQGGIWFKKGKSNATWTESRPRDADIRRRFTEQRPAEKPLLAQTAKPKQVECEDKLVVVAYPFESGAKSPAPTDIPDPVSLQEHQIMIQGIIMEGVKIDVLIYF